MNFLLTPFLVLQVIYPQLCLFFAIALKSSGVILLAWALVSFLHHRSAEARGWVWRCGLIGLGALLFFEFGPDIVRRARPALPIQPASGVVQFVFQQATTLRIFRSVAEVRQLEQSRNIGTTREPMPPWEAMPPEAIQSSDYRGPIWNLLETMWPVVWWSVGVFLAALALLRLQLGALWLRRRGTPAPLVLVTQCGEIAVEMGLRSQPEVRLATELRSPLLLGTFRSTVYLPVSATTWPEDKLRAVFLHEVAHVKRHDPFWQHFGRLVACLFWWNPLVAWAVRRLCAEAEEAADDEVLVRQGRAADYAGILVEIASNQGNAPVPEAGVSMVGHRALEKRIKALLWDNPWRGRIGRLPAGLMILILIVFFAGTSMYVGRADLMAAGNEPPAAPLTADQRQVLKRIVASTERRLAAWRFLHFKLESIGTYQDRSGTKTSPQPNRLEAWVDEWTGVHRAEFRPQVSPWLDGAAPFYISNVTEINDGQKLYSFESRDDLNNLHSRAPQGLEYYLGVSQATELVQTAARALESRSVSRLRLPMDEVDHHGRKLVRLREQIYQGGKMVQEKTWLMDPAQDDLLVFSGTAFPEHPANGSFWNLFKTGTTASGCLYPAEYETTDRSSKIWNKVTEFELLPALPAGLTDLPKSSSDRFISTTAAPIQPGEITFSYLNAENRQPVVPTSVIAQINEVPPQKLTADAAGHFVLSVPKEEIKALSVRANAPGFAPQVVTWRKYGEPLQLPESYTGHLMASAPISGRVVNDEGQPIAGAEVFLYLSGPESRSEIFSDRFDLGGITLHTNARGEWSLQDVPKNLDGLELRVSAAGYRPTTDGGIEDFRTSTGLTYDSLRNGTAVIKLARGLSFAGTVVDAAGQPVAGARLMIGEDRWGANLPSAESDSFGHFQFDGLSARSPSWLSVEASGLQPYAARIDLPASTPAAIRLAPGLVLRARVVDGNGAPCAGLEVVADQWRDLRTLGFHTQTDSEGRFSWNGAPPDRVRFTFIGRPQHKFLSGLWLTASDREQTVVMKPALRLTATVTDKSTGKAIEVVRVVPGRVVGAGDIYWETDDAGVYAQGAVDWKTDYLGDEKRVFRLEAEGYQPLQTREFDVDQQEVTENFALMPVAAAKNQPSPR